MSAQAVHTSDRDAAPKSPWEHFHGEEHIRAWFFAGVILSIGDVFIAIHLYSESADWLGSGLWMFGCIYWAYRPVKVLLAGPDPFSVERACTEWCLILGIILWMVGCSWCFLPKTGPRLLVDVDIIYLIGSTFIFISTIFPMIHRIGEVLPSRWPGTTRPPGFLVDFLSACFYMAASILAILETSDSAIQLGLCLWLPGSLLGLYAPHQMHRQNVDSGLLDDAFAERQFTAAAERQLTPAGGQVPRSGSRPRQSISARATPTSDLAAAPESSWEHFRGQEHIRALFFGAVFLSIGSACFPFQLHLECFLWLGYGFWIMGCMCFTYCPVKVLLAGPDPFSVERACNEWCRISGTLCWMVGCSLCFPPSTRDMLRIDVDRMFLIGSIFIFIPAAYQMINRIGEVFPSRWLGATRPPVFLVEFSAACFFMVAALLEGYDGFVELGWCLWLPGSLLSFYLPHELLRQKMEEEGELSDGAVAERQFMTPAERQLTPAGRQAMRIGLSPQVVARIATCAIALTVGYSQGSLSGSYPLIQAEMGLSTEQVSWLLGVIYFVMCIGALPGSLLADWVGRVNGLLVVYAMIVVSSMMSAIAVTFWEILAAQVMQGMGLGMALCIVSIYMTEVGPLASRGQYPAMEDGFCAVGMVAGYMLTLVVSGSLGGWRCVLCFTGMPSLLMMFPIVFGVVLESPRYLLMVGLKDKAEESLPAWIGQAEMEQVVATWRARGSELRGGPRGWSEVLWPAEAQSRRRIVASIGCMVAQMVSGCTVISFYCVDILEEDFDDRSATWISLFSLTGRIVMSVYIVLRIDTIGRRMPLLLSTAGCSAIYVFMAISYAFDCSPYVKVAGFFLYQICFAIGLGPVPFVYACEVVATEMRSKVVALGFIASRLYAGVWTTGFSSLQGALGDAGVFALCAVLNVVSFWFLYGAARETKGIELEDMERVFS